MDMPEERPCPSPCPEHKSLLHWMFEQIKLLKDLSFELQWRMTENYWSWHNDKGSINNNRIESTETRSELGICFAI